MDQIMEVLQPIIDTITGLIGGGEGAEGGFDISAIIDTVMGFINGIIGGGAA